MIHRIMLGLQCSAQAVQHRPRGAQACLVGLFSRPKFSAFRIRKEGHREGNGIRLLKTVEVYKCSTVLNVISYSV
jgi:hypothetical protein